MAETFRLFVLIPAKAAGSIFIRLRMLCLALGLAACGALPQPFQGAEQNDPMLETILVNPSVMIVPVTGAPAPLNQTIAEDAARAMQARDVAAVTRGGARTASLLQGQATTFQAADGGTWLRFEWLLAGPDGLPIDRLVTDVPAFQETANDPWLVYANTDLTPVTRQVADFVALHLLGTSAVMASVDVAEPRTNIPPDDPYHLFIEPVSGAPGDGAKSLTDAMIEILSWDGISIPLVLTAKPDAYSFIIHGRVKLKPTNEQMDIIAIDWDVKLPSGELLGSISQENAVPQNSLNGRWGDNAIYAAEAAADAILTLLIQFDPLVPDRIATPSPDTVPN
jgi:hypothetical protein